MKTNQSYNKRVRVTKSGKVISRKPGQDHFNAKAPRVKQLSQKKGQQIKLTSKAKARYLANI